MLLGRGGLGGLFMRGEDAGRGNDDRSIFRGFASAGLEVVPRVAAIIFSARALPFTPGFASLTAGPYHKDD
jgi:hypothetical protein